MYAIDYALFGLTLYNRRHLELQMLHGGLKIEEMNQKLVNIMPLGSKKPHKILEPA